MPHVSCESYRGLAVALRLGILWDEYRDLRDGFRVTNARCEEESADRDPSGALSVIERNLKAFGFRGLSARRALCNNDQRSRRVPNGDSCDAHAYVLISCD